MGQPFPKAKILSLMKMEKSSPKKVEKSVGEGEIAYLTLSQTTNFRLFQTERVCRQQF